MSLTQNLTAQDFVILVGRDPEGDDLERANCEKPGTRGHSQCGICPDHHKPRFECGCVFRLATSRDDLELDLSDPHTLEHYAQSIEDLRRQALLEHDGTGLDLVAEQHLAIALDLLSQARRQVTIACLTQARALGARR